MSRFETFFANVMTTLAVGLLIYATLTVAGVRLTPALDSAPAHSYNVGN